MADKVELLRGPNQEWLVRTGEPERAPKENDWFIGRTERDGVWVDDIPVLAKGDYPDYWKREILRPATPSEIAAHIPATPAEPRKREIFDVGFATPAPSSPSEPAPPTLEELRYWLSVAISNGRNHAGEFLKYLDAEPQFQEAKEGLKRFEKWLFAHPEKSHQQASAPAPASVPRCPRCQGVDIPSVGAFAECGTCTYRGKASEFFYPSPAPAPQAAIEVLRELQLQIERMDASAVRIGGEAVEAYQFKTGAWHRILGMFRGGEASAVLAAAPDTGELSRLLLKILDADKMAVEVDAAIKVGRIGSHSKLADARLNYGKPYTSEASGELSRKIAEAVAKFLREKYLTTSIHNLVMGDADELQGVIQSVMEGKP